MNDNIELAMHLWAGYQHNFEDQVSTHYNISNVAQFVSSLAKASEALSQQLCTSEIGYTGVFMYDVVQNAGGWLAGARNPTVEQFEAHVNTLVEKGIVK